MKQIIIFYLIVLLTSCGRTPGKIRFEEVSKTKIPDEFKVVQDEYQDMWQDYAIIYKIDFNASSAKDYINNIRASELYYYTEKNKKLTTDSLHKQGVWMPNGRGFQFQRQIDRTNYYFVFDTVTNRAEFNESAD